MKVSLNTIKRYIDFELPAIDELVEKINRQLGGVEEIIDLGAKYKGATIVRVVECMPLEGSDHLNITKIDDDGAVQDVERDQDGLIQVVCGAPNVYADMLAVWLPPGATVPATFDDDEPFVLGARKLRGVMSNGMLASPRELALGDDHNGILEIDPSEWKPSDEEIKPGADFAKVYGLDDTIIDIENKMFTHRPDCFGQLGVAREIAGIFGKSFTSPHKYKDMPRFADGSGLELKIINDIPDKVQRFMAVAIKDVTVRPSPLWLRCELVRLGGKPINNVVDVTNYIMLHTAQPVHAYDYDKVATGTLGIRLAKEGETIALLNGRVEELESTDIVITDGEKPIGLGGVMGGSETEVSDETRNLILECANFDMYTLRRTSMNHGLFTDAVTRFTKGQSPLQNNRVLLDMLEMVIEVAGGELASNVIDDKNLRTFSEDTVHSNLLVSDEFINDRLGLKLTHDDIQSLLKNVEFVCDGESYTAPFWRTDIEIPEDIVEEVGRLYGFDKLPLELPRRTLKPAPVNTRLTLKTQIREALRRAGANEVLTYSFVHKNILDRAGQDADDAYQLSNALSPDLHYFRRTVLPSLLDKVHMNIKAGYDIFAIFEIGKGHRKAAGLDHQGVPLEQEYVSLALSTGGFYQAKALTEFLASSLGLLFEYVPIEKGKLFEPRRGALIRVNGKIVGAVGEYRALIRRNFKLPDDAAGFELSFDTLAELVKDAQETYRPLSRFPSAERDVTFKVSHDRQYAEMMKAMLGALDSLELETTVSPLGIYRPEDSDTKNVTFRVRFTSHDRTLTGDEVSAFMDQVSSVVCNELGATVV